MEGVRKEQSVNKQAVWIVLALLTLPPLFWAGNFIVGRAVRADIPPLTLSFFRWVIACLILIPFSLNIFRREWRLYWQNRWLVLLSSITGVSAFNSLIYMGLQSTTANNAMILNAFIPLLISLLGVVFLRFKLKAKQWSGLAISLIGVLIIVSHGEWKVLASFSFNRGDLVVFLAMLCWAVYTLILKKIPSSISRLGLTSLQMVLGMICLFPFYLTELQAGMEPNWNMQALLSLAYVGIVPSVLAYLIYNASVERLGPTKAGLSINLLPVFGMLLSALFLGESVYAYQMFGMLLIFLGLTMS